MRNRFLPLLSILCWIPVIANAAVSRPALTLSDARQVIAAAVAYARAHQAPGGAIAVVDEGGSVIALERLDGTFPSGPNISIGKARTAAGFNRATREIENAINKGRFTMTALPAVTTFTPLEGGVPLSVGGQIVGAVGVSGAANAQQDDDIAQAAADAFAAAGAKTAADTKPAADARPAEVRYVPALDVQRAFAAGATLVATDEFKVNASRRDTPGGAEVHVRDTDIIYVLGGTAALVTGGEVIDPVASSADEVRGRAIRGGSEIQLSKGDVVTVPNGVPHWFKHVQAPFTYYVVKTTHRGD